MGVSTQKFSQFADGGGIESGDEIVGLRTGVNTFFGDDSEGLFVPLPYTIITSLTFQMVANNGYIANNVGTVIFTLPLLFNVGDIIEVSGMTAAGWKILQNAGQNIIFGSVVTTSGAGGSLQSTALGDSMVLKGAVANTTMIVIGGSQGNITIV